MSAPQQQYPGAGQPGQHAYPPQPGQPGATGGHAAPGQPPHYPAQPHQPQGAYPVHPGAHVAGYAPGPYGHPVYAIQQSSGLAITSLVLSLLGLFTCGLTSIAGLICGHIALSRAKRDPHRYGGHGMALAGTIIGYALAVLIIGGSIAVFSYLGAHGCFADNPSDPVC
ncbi:MAG: DUF4190 domain-containing protein [Thermoleophilia bacterium]|nr:DUF4190 domain-containing protein [Thermoleophilia bacterium]